jgi:Cupin domain
VNPSVITLYALVRELGLTMGDLFAADDGSEPSGAQPASTLPVVGPAERAVINLASGVTWERLTAERDSSVEFLLVTYDVGSESCSADSLVTHGGREYGYVISGRLGVRIGFDEYDLGPDDSISFDSSSPHPYGPWETSPSLRSGSSSAGRATIESGRRVSRETRVPTRAKRR